ncbi:unnamed protein product [Meloidogyne enterolobii]|uniref:Uncharacterized protein n=1 Tax=Meloidogyne enterolobii TaxID=390850 RepID=A0ACB0ZMS8_MELEN
MVKTSKIMSFILIIYISIISMPSFNLAISLYGRNSLINNNSNNRKIRAFMNFNFGRSEEGQVQGNKRMDKELRKKNLSDNINNALRLIELVASQLNSKQTSLIATTHSLSTSPFSPQSLSTPSFGKLNEYNLDGNENKENFNKKDKQKNEIKKQKKIEEEPLVIRHYNRDCFFTPINCFVGKAGEEATNIVGSASNSRKHVLFIRRRN